MNVDANSQESDDVTDRVPSDGGKVEDDAGRTGTTSGHAQMEGFVEKRGFNGQWQKCWCVLRDGCLYCYIKADDHVPSDVTELKGYDVTQLFDKFQGKRFVLSLKHASYISVLLSVDSRDELTEWYETIKATLEGSTVTSEGDKTASQDEVTSPRSAAGEVGPELSQSPSAQTVKQKLLAEMLRQKLELEKMQAARNGMKGDLYHSTSSSVPGSPLVTDDDRICALTRLRQRRMSTQIKLNAIQKQMEASTSSPKEKKNVFQLGKKKPDLVPSHAEGQGPHPDLEEQVKVLSSRLQELDTCITSHGALSPRDSSPSRVNAKSKNLRHSYDPSILRELSGGDTNKDAHEDSDGDSVTKSKEKDVSKGGSLKSSVQKLAHRTFAKANWHWSKKSHSNTVTDRVDSGNNSSLSDLTPDVIDMTNNNTKGHSNNGGICDADGTEYPAPPDNFKSDYTLLTGTMPGRRKAGGHRTPKERILSKISSSSSLTNLDRFNTRLQGSSSSPSLVKLAAKPTGEVDSGQNSPTTAESLRLPLSKLTNGNEEGGNLGGTLSPPDSARSQGSSVTSPRREVNPNALAEIEAFEELSLKFLGSSTGSK